MIEGLDLGEKYVRDFVRRMGYFLAAEWAAMPDGPLREVVCEYCNDFIDMLGDDDHGPHMPEPDSPGPLLERVK